MSIQRTAESALHSLEELYRAIDSATHQPSPMSINDSENLVQALCNLSQLIRHINETGMCGHPTNLDCNRITPKRNQPFFDPHLTHYEDSVYMNSVPNESDYGECILYHPIRIITTSADRPIVIRENDSMKHDHLKRFSYGRYTKANRRKMSRSHDLHSEKTRTRHNRSSSRGSRASSRRSRRSSSNRTSQIHGRSSRSNRRSVRNSKSRHRRRSRSNKRRSRSSQRNSQRRSRSRRRSSHKQQSSDRKYHDRQIPSRPIATSSSYPSNQISSTSTANQPSSLPPQPHIRSEPNATASSSSVQPNSFFAPTIPLPPPPITSSLHHSHMLPQIPTHDSHNPLSIPEYQQVPGNDLKSSQQQQQITQPLTTADSLLTSRSENCPECRAITRLLQWAPLKCYDAAGIRRGVFLAGPKSEQLLQALYASMKDSSFSLDDIEDCLCDNE